MKKYTFLILFTLFCSFVSFSQIIESHRIAANALWETYGRDNDNPSQMPDAVPLNLDANVDQIVIDPNFRDLEVALKALVDTNGGVLRFNNTTPVTINFNNVIEIKPLFQNIDKERTIVIQGENITFNGQNNNSLFVVRGNLRLIIQDAGFKNANFQGISQSHLNSIFRSGGGAIEVAQVGSYSASLRVRNCHFIDNTVSHFSGVGENQNGAGIRFNYKTTGEVFGCVFKNNKAVTGGAIGATSVNRLTVIDSNFEGNLSNGYKSTTGFMNVVEGAGAIRLDRTIKPVEIYGSEFIRNSANVKVSVIEVFIRPVSGANPSYPNNGPSLIIDNCLFKENTYNNYAGVSNFERAFFSGCIVFHSGGIDGSFSGGKMKLTNSVFDSNEVGQANIRMINDFEISDCIFANTQYLDIIDATQQGAVFLQKVNMSGSFNNCTFYKNEPRNGALANDIMFWTGDIPSKVQLNNSIFYRTNTNTNTKQVRLPLMGSGNNQHIPSVNMSSFAQVANGASYLTNPNIQPENIISMCLGDNTLPRNIGGLPDCEVLSAAGSIWEGFVISPNPTSDFINISSNSKSTAIESIKILDVHGRIIKTYTTEITKKFKVDLSFLESAVYFIQVHAGKGFNTRRIIKK